MEFSETLADLAEQGSDHVGQNVSILDDPVFENIPWPFYILHSWSLCLVLRCAGC